MKRILPLITVVLLVGCVKKDYAPTQAYPALPGYEIPVSDKWKFVPRMSVVTSSFKNMAKGYGVCDGAFVRKGSGVRPPVIFLKRMTGGVGPLPSIKEFMDKFHVDFMVKNGIVSVTKSINGVVIDKDNRSIAVDVSLRHNNGRALNVMAKAYVRERGALWIFCLADDRDVAIKKELRDILSNVIIRPDLEYKLEGYPF